MLLLFALIADVNTVVKVDDRAYRVETHGNEVKVYQKAAFTKASIKRRARMREAVRIVTGCRIVDDYWKETALEGLLDCSLNSAAPLKP